MEGISLPQHQRKVPSMKTMFTLLVLLTLINTRVSACPSTPPPPSPTATDYYTSAENPFRGD